MGRRPTSLAPFTELLTPNATEILRHNNLGTAFYLDHNVITQNFEGVPFVFVLVWLKNFFTFFWETQHKGRCYQHNHRPQTPTPQDCQLVYLLGFGPRLSGFDSVPGTGGVSRLEVRRGGGAAGGGGVLGGPKLENT